MFILMALSKVAFTILIRNLTGIRSEIKEFVRQKPFNSSSTSASLETNIQGNEISYAEVIETIVKN